MYKENGFAYRFLIIFVIFVIAIAGVILNKIVGKNGVVEKAVVVENNFTKENVLDKINYLSTQYFIELNKQANESNQVISNLYNSDVVIEYLKQNNYIENLYDEDGNEILDTYVINIDKLYENEEKHYAKSGNYYIKKQESVYNVIYKDDIGEELIGELQIQQV